MTLEFVGVLAGVAAEQALEGPLARVRADVALQLAGLGRTEGTVTPQEPQSGTGVGASVVSSAGET